jgi:hypothetical protein
LKLIGCEKFSPKVPRIFSQAHLKEEGSEGLKNCGLLMPWRTKVLSTSFYLHVVPWIEYFGCKVTFLGLLDFEASYWLKCKVFTTSCLNVKRA